MACACLSPDKSWADCPQAAGAEAGGSAGTRGGRRAAGAPGSTGHGAQLNQLDCMRLPGVYWWGSPDKKGAAGASGAAAALGKGCIMWVGTGNTEVSALNPRRGLRLWLGLWRANLLLRRRLHFAWTPAAARSVAVAAAVILRLQLLHVLG